MIAPERVHDYQKEFAGSGQERVRERDPERRSRYEKSGRDRKTRVRPGIAVELGRGRSIGLSVILFAALCMMISIVMTAYAAAVTYDINKLESANKALAGEIETMNVELMSAGNIGYVEKQAEAKLGMKAPGPSSCVYISTDSVPERGFAEILKNKAYD